MHFSKGYDAYQGDELNFYINKLHPTNTTSRRHYGRQSFVVSNDVKRPNAITSLQSIGERKVMNIFLPDNKSRTRQGFRRGTVVKATHETSIVKRMAGIFREHLLNKQKFTKGNATKSTSPIDTVAFSLLDPTKNSSPMVKNTNVVRISNKAQTSNLKKSLNSSFDKSLKGSSNQYDKATVSVMPFLPPSWPGFEQENHRLLGYRRPMQQFATGWQHRYAHDQGLFANDQYNAGRHTQYDPATQIQGGVPRMPKPSPWNAFFGSVKFHMMTMKQATQSGELGYYTQLGCFDPTPPPSRTRSIAPTKTLWYGCQSPVSHSVCSKIGPQRTNQFMASFLRLNPQLNSLLEKCLTPKIFTSIFHNGYQASGLDGALGVNPVMSMLLGGGELWNANIPSFDGRFIGRQKPASATNAHTDCSMVLPIVMSKISAAGEGFHSPEHVEAIISLRKQYLSMKCQEINLLYTSMPIRLCCPGTGT